MNKFRHHIRDKNTRIESLDFLRGIAACAVMLFHYSASTSIYLSEGNPLRIIGAYGHFGVEVFFILSGFIIPYSMYVSSYKLNMIGKFLIKRTLRIEIPYLVIIGLEVLLIYVSTFTPWKNGPSERLDTCNILLHIGYLNGLMGKTWLIPIFWTLAIEFQFYLLIAVLFPLFLQSKLSYRIPTIGVIIFLSFVFPQPYLFFTYGLFFMVGILTFQLTVGIVKFGEFISLMIGFLILLYFQSLPFSLFIVALTISVILFAKWNWKWSGFLGMISYSLYLIHVPFGGRLLMLTQMYVQTEWIKIILILMYMVSTIFVAWLFYLLVEVPALRLSKKIVYKNRV